LSAPQQKQFSALEAEHQKETEKLVGEVLKLSPDQRKQSEVREKAARIREETRRRIQTLLTPQQWATLKDNEFRETAPTVLRETVLPERTFGPAKSPGVQKKIALDDQQLATLRRLFEDYEAGRERRYQEANRKAFDVLTPQQQDEIRAVMDRQGW
jgi:hypothetical protein